MGSLLPPDGQEPSYAQLYIYDAEEATRRCMNRNQNSDLRGNILLDLHNMLIENHRYAAVYKQAHTIIQEKPPEQRRDVQMHLYFQPGTDSRRYNLPTVEEVAAIVPGDGSEDVREHREIILRTQGGGLRRISHLHPSYLCLHYVLLFP